MRIVIAGGSGFLGSALSRRLATAGHSVVVLTRDGLAPRAPGLVRYAAWTPDGETGTWARELDGADAVVNLAGASLAGKRWTASRKRVLRDSRILSTRSLVRAIHSVSGPPTAFIQGSALGFYGAFENGPTLDERSPAGSDFLATLCVEWEAEARPLEAAGRVVYLRTGLALSKHGGALAKMITPFRMFVGGPVGSGRHYMPWIHLDDWVGVTMWALESASVSGPINGTAPNPVRNAEFAQALGRALHRPSWFAVPPPMLRLLFGEMTDAMLLRGACVVPTRALELGYVFRYERIDEAMRAAVA